MTSFKAFSSILKLSFSMHNLRPEFLLHENKLRCCFNMETKVSFFSASVTSSAVCLASVTTHHIVYLKKRQISGFSLLCKFHRVKIMLGEWICSAWTHSYEREWGLYPPGMEFSSLRKHFNCLNHERERSKK